MPSIGCCNHSAVTAYSFSITEQSHQVQGDPELRRDSTLIERNVSAGLLFILKRDIDSADIANILMTDFECYLSALRTGDLI